jgi:hypothetical protein
MTFPSAECAPSSRSGNHTQSFIFKSVSYEPLADSIFEPPQAVKTLMK